MKAYNVFELLKPRSEERVKFSEIINLVSDWIATGNRILVKIGPPT